MQALCPACGTVIDTTKVTPVLHSFDPVQSQTHQPIDMSKDVHTVPGRPVIVEKTVPMFGYSNIKSVGVDPNKPKNEGETDKVEKVITAEQTDTRSPATRFQETGSTQVEKESVEKTGGKPFVPTPEVPSVNPNVNLNVNPVVVNPLSVKGAV